MPVDRQPRKLERVATDDIRGLASDSWKFDKLIRVARHVAAIFRNQRLGHPEQATRLGAEKAGRLNDLLEIFGGSLGQCLGIWIACEDDRRDLIDARIGALR